MKLSDLFKRLNAEGVISVSHEKDRAAIKYSVILAVKEYEELEKKINKKKKSQ